MKIALVNPNSPFLTNERVFPNMGLVRVATQLNKEGHQADILDFAGIDPENMKSMAHKYDVYGFSSTTPQLPYVMNLFSILKRENHNARTIIGGPHPTSMYYLKHKKIEDHNIDDLEIFDTIFVGEGEDTTNLFKPGWQHGKTIKNIDDTPIPDRGLIDILGYDYNLFEEKTTSIQTQRGCPYKCSFCSGRDIPMYNRVRMHSPKRVLEEMDQLHDEYGYSSFMWYDDEINVNINRLEKLCKELSKRPYQHRGFIRSDQIEKHPDSVKWMRDAGFVKLCAGVESGSDKMLKRINKGVTSDQNTKARELIRKENIHYESFLLVGHPGETIDDLMDTALWIENNKPDDFDVNLITPYPGSKIYDEAKPSKTFKDYNWEFNGMFFNKPRYSRDDSFYKGLNAQSESNIRTLALSNKELRFWRDTIDMEYKK